MFITVAPLLLAAIATIIILIQASVHVKSTARIKALTAANDQLKAAFGTFAKLSVPVTMGLMLDNIRLDAKARRANIRAGRAEQRAAHFRRKLYRRQWRKSSAPLNDPASIGASIIGDILGSSRPAARPFPTFQEFLAMGGGEDVHPLSAPYGKSDSVIHGDPYAEIASRLSPFKPARGLLDLDTLLSLIASQGKNVRTRGRTWDGQTNQQPDYSDRKPFSVADLERDLGLVPGSTKVVQVTPGVGERELTGAEADAAIDRIGPGVLSREDLDRVRADDPYDHSAGHGPADAEACDTQRPPERSVPRYASGGSITDKAPSPHARERIDDPGSERERKGFHGGSRSGPLGFDG